MREIAEQKGPFTPRFVPPLSFLDSRSSAYARLLQAEAIINGADRAFSDSSGNNFDGETFNDTCNSPFRASNLEEAKAMVEALERAQGK